MGIRLGFVVSEFNRDITYMMEVEAREHAAFLGAEVTKCRYVPGRMTCLLQSKRCSRRETSTPSSPSGA